MSDKLSLWWYQNQAIRRRKQKKKKIIAALALVLASVELESPKQRSYSKKRYWTHPLWEARHECGFYERIFPMVANSDEMFRVYMRMTLVQFEALLEKVGPEITKQHVVRVPIPAAARLSMTLRYLATGDCMTSTSFSYLVGFTTAQDIINETCHVIWKQLKKEVMSTKKSTADWLKIAKDFEDQWDFPLCIGAIDGKHIAIKCPDNAGSEYFNYKHFHSVVLMAICDANYNFIFVDVGAVGRRSDGGIFKDSIMGQKFANNLLNVPNPKQLMADGNPLPYVLVADEAFQMNNFLMRPYPGKSLVCIDRRIYNYRLSRARRTIENTFGIMVNRWQVLKRTMESNPEHTTSTVKAIVCLHNWLRQQDAVNYLPVLQDDALAKEVENSVFEDTHFYSNHNSTSEAIEIREELCQYFNREGAVVWQYDQCK